MTRPWRAGILIAFFAALLGAPSAVLGAPSNQLSSPTVSATSGSTSTLFTFAVRYISSHNAAGSVTVSVAGETLAMARVAGTATNGRYQASASLPAGTWIPTFEAHPSNGPRPSMSGPQVHVGAPATPRPSLLPTLSLPPTPSPLDGPPPSGEVMPAGDAPAPTAVVIPQPSAGDTVGAPLDDAPDPVGATAASTHEHVDATADPAKATSRGGGSAAAPVDPASESAASASPELAASPSSGDQRSPAPGLSPAPFTGSDSPWTVLALAVFGVSTLGILAIAWVLLGRRRRAGGEPLPATWRAARDTAATTEELLGRAARRSRLDPSDDPIIAAMGLRPPTDATPRYSAGQVDQGPGERPLRETKRRRRS
ncbi:MAG TPA: hypothetical protein VFX74_04985 [Candidatus Limnocylindria bacterium]|nr:hypothetical protein [Candidatus Limnocylindria bacterium]